MKDLLDRYADIIADYHVTVWETQPTSYRFNAQVTFIDGSSLQIRDYLFPNKRKYAYQWQDKSGNLNVRWDNAPHWKAISTYPHHQHREEGVCSSQETCLEDVLQHIAKILRQ